MITTIHKFECDLCSRSITRHDITGGKMKRVRVGSTDPAGHYNDSEKHLCFECCETIEKAKVEIVPV